MHHHGPLALGGRIHVGEVEALGHPQVHLDSRQGERATQYVADVDVDLRSVEGGVPRGLGPSDVSLVQNGSQRCFGDVPVLGPTGPSRAIPVATAQANLLDLDPQRVIAEVDHLQGFADLLPHLFGPAEDVGVVQGHRPDPTEPADDT